MTVPADPTLHFLCLRIPWGGSGEEREVAPLVPPDKHSTATPAASLESPRSSAAAAARLLRFKMDLTMPLPPSGEDERVPAPDPVAAASPSDVPTELFLDLKIGLGTYP